MWQIICHFLIHTHTHIKLYCCYISRCMREHIHTRTHTSKQASCFTLLSSLFSTHSFFFHIAVCVCMCAYAFLHVDRRRRRRRRTNERAQLLLLLYVWEKAMRETCTSCLCVFFSFTTDWLGHISLLFVVHSKGKRATWSYLFICFLSVQIHLLETFIHELLDSSFSSNFEYASCSCWYIEESNQRSQCA